MKLAQYNHAMQRVLEGDHQSSTLFTASSCPDYYMKSIQQRYVEALDACYPACRRLVGDPCWYGLLHQYLRDRQVSTADLSELGRQLSDFILTTPLHQQLVYFADLARFEWCWFRCFHGDTRSTSEPGFIAATSSIQSAADLQLLESAYPLASIWEMCQAEYEGDFQLPPEDRTYHFAFISCDERVQVKGVTKAGFELLQGLRQPTLITSFDHEGRALIDELQQHQLLEVVS